MTSSTYGFLVHLAFEKNIDKPYCPSIRQMILVTDALAKKMDCEIDDVSLSTKYQIINDLMDNGLLVVWRKGKKKRLKFSEKVREYNLQTINECQILLVGGQEPVVKKIEQKVEPEIKEPPKQKGYQLRIREVALPIVPITKIGTSSGIIIPKYMMAKHDLKEGINVRPILHIKKEVVKV